MINFADCGGIGDGKTDNLEAWAKAVASFKAQGGDRLYIPSGKYLSTAPWVCSYPNGEPYSVTIVGDGQDATDIYWPNSDGLWLTANHPRHGIHLRDLTLSTGVQGHIGLNLVNGVAEGNFCANDLTRVTFRGSDGGQGAFGWVTNINIENWCNINSLGLLIYGAGNGYGNGCIINSSAPRVSGGLGIVYNFSQCGWFNLGIGIDYCSIQGLTENQGNHTNGITGIRIRPGSVNCSQLSVGLTQFGVSGIPVLIQAPINGVSLGAGNFFICAHGMQPVVSTVGPAPSTAGSQVINL